MFIFISRLLGTLTHKGHYFLSGSKIDGPRTLNRFAYSSIISGRDVLNLSDYFFMGSFSGGSAFAITLFSFSIINGR